MLFIVVYKNYIVYYNVYHGCICVFIEKHMYTKFRLDLLYQ